VGTKHILYFHQYFSTGSGATGTRSYEFAKRLIADGYQVTMVCCSTQLNNISSVGKNLPKGPNTYFVEGIKVIEFPLNYSNLDGLLTRTIKFLNFAIQSTQLVFTQKYDLLFATSTPLTVAIPGIVAKFFLRKKFVFEVRDLWPELPKAMGVVKSRFILSLLSLLEWLAYHCADSIIALSPGIESGILKRCKKAHVHMIPNGCDLEVFYPINKSDVSISQIKQDDFVAIFTGAHGLANGLDSVLDTAKLLKDRSVNHIKFLFIGDGKEKKRLVKRALEENIDNCIFLDPISKNKLNLYLAKASVGLMVLKNIPAFYYGTSPNKFFDYISAGLPVLNNYPGWLCEMINQFQAGKTIPPDNTLAFANALIELSQNPELLKNYGINARNLAETGFNRDVLSKKFVNVISGNL
jgi:glycosyltransferase involved in cell wall biosynthesis